MREVIRRVGPWDLLEKLGEGGNSKVYRATRDDGGSFVALKVVDARKRSSERFRRFLAEVDIHRRLGRRAGILPMVDFDLAESEDEAWMAMPVAMPLAAALGGVGDLGVVVEAVAAIARTLAGLHAEGVSHRDIKPQNLYSLDGDWVIGDFGLVDYPEKEDFTAEGRKLGPQNFLAPEMLASTGDCEGGPADVYSLAKTLWVLVTDQRWPPPGELRIETRGMRMTDFREHARLGLLDPLLSRATRHEVQERSSMDSFARELEAWLTPPPDRELPHDVADLAARLRVATADEFRSNDTRAALRSEGIALTREFARTIQEDIGAVVSAAGIRADTVVRNLGDLQGTSPEMPEIETGVAWAEGRWLRVQTPNDALTLCTGSRLTLLNDRSVYVRAAHVLRLQNETRILWAKDYATEVGTLHASQCVREVVNDLQREFRSALEAFTSAVESEPDDR